MNGKTGGTRPEARVGVNSLALALRAVRAAAVDGLSGTSSVAVRAALANLCLIFIFCCFVSPDTADSEWAGLELLAAVATGVSDGTTGETGWAEPRLRFFVGDG